MKTIVALFLTILPLTVLAQTASSAAYQNDTFFPAKGHFNAGVLTTYSTRNPPPILLGEVSYGISNKFSVGAVGGSIGVLALYGGKMNAILYQHQDFRLAFKFMSVYYPGRDGKFLFDRTDKHIMPWMLSTAAIDAEWRTARNIRWTVGLGMTETHCIDGMKRLFTRIGGGPVPPADEDDLKLDVLTTLRAGASIPLSKRLTLRPEAFAVFKGINLIKRGEHKVGFPVIASLTFVYSF